MNSIIPSDRQRRRRAGSRRRVWPWLGGFCLLLLARINGDPAAAQYVDEPASRAAFVPSEVAIVVNTASPLSEQLGAYYRQARGIPAGNVVRVNLQGSPPVLSAAAFSDLARRIQARLDSSIQVIVLVWTAPYAVECNSITSALSLGFQPDQCLNPCGPGRLSPLYDVASTRPFTDLGVRLTMLLPSQSLEEGKALIDRGVRSDGRQPVGTAYFLDTSDTARSSRARWFPPSGHLAHPWLELATLKADSIEDKQDVMFYFTGLIRVPKLETLTFLPGAVADHLTSTGGDLLGTAQMSSLRWLQSGATASYGTVSEPCNYWQKFPNPAVLLKHYLRGESVVSAYWKSVAWPVQGVFIGEPLASPYGR